MNENLFPALFDSSDDDLLSRTIDRFADGECSATEQAELFARLDAMPGAWKQCALALVEARDLRAALSGVGRGQADNASRTAVDESVALASPTGARDEAAPPRRRRLATWSAFALGTLIAFATGFAVAPREGSDATSLAGGQSLPGNNAINANEIRANADQRSQGNNRDLIASGARPDATGAASSGPEIVNVVYRPDGSEEESSAPLPLYKSDEAWARALDQVVRQSEADLAERRAKLLAQGADLERQIVLHPVATEQGEMLLPVETFQIVPVSLSSFH